MNKHSVYALLLASTLLLLASCQSTSVKPNAHQQQINTLESAETLLADADKLTGRAKIAQLLVAADIFANNGQPLRAIAICKSIDPSALDDALYAKHVRIQSQSLLATDSIYGAKGKLEQTRLTALLTQLTLPEARKLRELRADIYLKIGEPAKAIKERIALNTLPLDPVDDQLNREIIWMTLMEMDLQSLNDQLQSAQSTLQQGWYELAIVSKNNQRNINQQFNALNLWRSQWTNHPANNPLPADLALIDNIVNNQPKHIALLLPLTGRLAPVAEAIRDGFMAAYFSNRQNGGSAPKISLYDSNQLTVSEQYDHAVSDGAEVVIGPLSKESISELALRPDLPIPTLALNQIEASANYPQALFQLGLAIEDEAYDAAIKALQDNKELAMIIAPEGSQGERAVQVFTEHYQKLGGKVVETLRYNNERALSGLIEQAMHLNDSRERARALGAIVGKIEFEPRRRSDIDCIFLLAQPREARQIKPLLAYHYAGDIPIYSTSGVYEGSNKREPDLEGIRFSNLPWFYQQSPEKTAITQGKNLNARTQKLYALGVDAYYLYPRLEQLYSANRANFWGQTGTLSLNEQRQFLRKQQWAYFKNGRVVVDKVATSDIVEPPAN